MNTFYLDEYLIKDVNPLIKKTESAPLNRVKVPFSEALKIVSDELDYEWEKTKDSKKEDRILREKGAIIGEKRDMAFFKEKIKKILIGKNLLSASYPNVFPNLTEAIFQELYGLSYLAPWVYDYEGKYTFSQSAKLIGSEIFFMVGGTEILQKEEINYERRKKLLRALLMDSPKERIDSGYHEVYLKNGIRITIFSDEDGLTRKGQDTIILRKYVIRDLSFENLERYGTIPKEAIPLFKLMVKAGYNLIFAGQVRTGKTTFLETWQSYEDPTLEGVTISSDTEVDFKKVNPRSPIIQLIADGEDLARVERAIKRSDPDYIILTEMRSPESYNFYLDTISMGTRRSKATIHSNDALSVPYKVASKVRAKFGGDEDSILQSFFENVDFGFELVEIPNNRAKKRLNGIVEYSYDKKENKAMMRRIMAYDEEDSRFRWAGNLSDDKREKIKCYPGLFDEIMEELTKLKSESPLFNEEIILPNYFKGNRLKDDNR